MECGTTLRPGNLSAVRKRDRYDFRERELPRDRYKGKGKQTVRVQCCGKVGHDRVAYLQAVQFCRFDRRVIVAGFPTEHH